MKNNLKVIFLALFQLVFILSIGFAQEKTDDQEMQTLFRNQKISVGGMGGPQVGLSQFNDREIWLVGCRGGVVINHSLVIGGGGWGIVNMPKFTGIAGNTYAYIEGGYGGMLIEPIIKSNKLVHIAVPILIGAGNLMYVKEIEQDPMDPLNEIDNDSFFVLEPGIEIELNVVRFMRIAAGIRYRWAPNLDLVDTPSNPFNGITSSITFKFGKF